MKIIRVVVALLWIMGMATVALAAAEEKEPSEYPIAATVVVIGANGETGAESISVRPGDYFRVVFYAAGGTGYGWALDSESLSLIEKAAVNTEPVSKEPLTGGKVRWNFYLRVKPEATGQEILHFYLSRPWEKNVKPVQAFDLTLDVK